uniref:HVA22-like protein n=1 Tax=Rhizophora mucronata TaxID=61149 RepID=A0A2P2L214_RHIMU
MIGSFLTRGLMMVFGYAYPAYECYKTVEKNKPEIEQLRFWCQYWILVAVLTVCERIGDAFISWVPMYSEAKLAFFIYLWYPKTKGTTYVYDSFFKPYVAKHESEIDRNLLELRTRAGDMAVLYWQRAMSYGQSRVFEILQYVAAQSTPKPHLAQVGYFSAAHNGSQLHIALGLCIYLANSKLSGISTDFKSYIYN